MEFAFTGPGLPATKTFAVAEGGLVSFSFDLPGTGQNVATFSRVNGVEVPVQSRTAFGGNYCPR